MARSERVGALIHETIGVLASETLNPPASRILEAANACVTEFAKIEGRAHRQNVAAGAAAYFTHLLPPASWLFLGAEVHLGHGRLDLLWSDFEGRILIDEVKSGHSRSLHLTRTREQVQRYIDCGTFTWGSKFLGLRLLSTGDPFVSQHIAPDGACQNLFATDFVRGAR